MTKDDFSLMNKMNEVNAFRKFDVCEKEFNHLRTKTFETF